MRIDKKAKEKCFSPPALNEACLLASKLPEVGSAIYLFSFSTSTESKKERKKETLDEIPTRE